MSSRLLTNEGGVYLTNKLFAPNVLAIARLLSNNTQLIMILRSGSLNEVGYAARLICGIEIKKQSRPLIIEITLVTFLI